ncbi:phage tail tape measure protein [Clostridium oceanicum]|uniref:Uncharacterized protein n=1 Tax=Clostridium oceanicum TaxID=1543 RepID=A0ABN1JCD6_9CLOT
MALNMNSLVSLNDKLSDNLVRVNKNVQKMSTQMQKSAQEAADFVNKFKGGFESIGNKAIKTSSVIAKSLGKSAFKTGLSEAMDMEGFRLKLESATKSAKKTGKIMNWSVNYANSTPFETKTVLEASSRLEAMGMSAKKNIPLLADMAGATNKPLMEAVEAQAAAQNGQLGKLEEFGIKKTDIIKKGNQMFRNAQIINSKGEIKDQKKFNQVLNALMIERYKGGAAKLGETVKGMWDTVKGVTKSSFAKILGITAQGTIKQGSLLDIIKGKIKQVADTLIKWQSDGTMDAIANKAAEVFSTIYNVISDLFSFIIKHKDTILDIAIAFASFYTAIKIINTLRKTLFGIQVAMFLLKNTLLLNPISLMLVGIAALIAGFVLLYKNSETFRNAISQIGQYIATNIFPIFQQMYQFFITNILPVLIQLGNFIMANVLPILQQLGSFLVNILGIALQGLWSILMQIWTGVIVPLYNFFVAYILPVIQTIGQVILWLISTVLMPLVSFILGNLMASFQNGFQFILGIVSTVVGTMSGVIQGILTILQGIIDFVIGVFTGDWDRAWEGIKEIFSGIWQGIESVVKGILNGIIDSINWVIRGMNNILSFKVPDWAPKWMGAGKTVGVNIPEISKFAKGTKYSPSGLALINEKGGELRKLSSGETIIPAQKSREILNNASSPNINIYIQGNVGSEEFFDQAGNKIASKIKLALGSM